MEKAYMASVRDDQGQVILIESDYKSRKEFVEDLRRNGYKVRFAALKENFDEACEKYHLKLERTKERGFPCPVKKSN